MSNDPMIKKPLIESMESKQESILTQAHNVVNGDRADTYGSFQVSFERIADLWSAYLGYTIKSVDVAHMMILLKVSRSTKKYHQDNYVDMAGYADLADRLQR